MSTSIIVAISDNNVIGKNNDLPWYLPDDLKRFSKLTKGNSVIMGRKTYESILARLKKPLPDRQNIIITRQKNYDAPGCIVVDTFEKALKAAGSKEVFVIGGAYIYILALPYADTMYITRVHGTFDGDAFFADFNKDHWKLVSSEQHAKDEKHAYDFSYEMWKKNPDDAANFVFLPHAREEDQRKVMENIRDEGHCPFCQENLRKYHKEPILKEGKYWILTNNQWPYKDTKMHLLAILKRHAERLGELTPEEGAELFELFQWAERHHRILGGGFAMRFGDMRFSGGTVRHLHAQFIVPDIEKEGAEAVKFKIGHSKNKSS